MSDTDREKTDFKKLMKPYWAPPVGRFELLEVPELKFLMVDGAGDPNTSEDYRQAVQWLYSLSYGLKFASKARGHDYGVAPLEGLWWSNDMSDFAAGRKDKWSWTAMIMQPDWIRQADVDAAVGRARQKLGVPPTSLRLEDFAEGYSAQTMFVGPTPTRDRPSPGCTGSSAGQWSQAQGQASRDLSERSEPHGPR